MKSKFNFVRNNIDTSYIKMKRYIDQLKGLNLGLALAMTTRNMTGSTKFEEIFNQALRIALNNFKQSDMAYKDVLPSKIFIREIFATKGRTVKRMETRARRRSNILTKHRSHLFINLGVKEEKIFSFEAFQANMKKDQMMNRNEKNTKELIHG